MWDGSLFFDQLYLHNHNVGSTFCHRLEYYLQKTFFVIILSSLTFNSFSFQHSCQTCVPEKTDWNKGGRRCFNGLCDHSFDRILCCFNCLYGFGSGILLYLQSKGMLRSCTDWNRYEHITVKFKSFYFQFHPWILIVQGQEKEEKGKTIIIPYHHNT